MSGATSIYCCGCGHDVQARLTNGSEIYPHRQDLYGLPFWKCDTCGNYVGCHHKTAEPTKPLGNIPTKELQRARQHIHRILDPLWMQDAEPKRKRRHVYAKLSDKLGYQYHTAEIKSVEDARAIYRIVKEIAAAKSEAA